MEAGKSGRAVEAPRGSRAVAVALVVLLAWGPAMQGAAAETAWAAEGQLPPAVDAAGAEGGDAEPDGGAAAPDASPEGSADDPAPGDAPSDGALDAPEGAEGADAPAAEAEALGDAGEAAPSDAQAAEASAMAPPSDRSLAPGAYVLRSALADRQVVDVRGGSLDDGARLQLYGSNMTAAQRFVVSYEQGFAVIANAASGKVADVQGAQVADGTPVQAYGSNGTAAQRWSLQPNGDGSYTLLSALDGGKALDVAGASSANGTPLQLWSANGTAAQRFFFLPTEPSVQGTAAVAEGFYAISSALDGSPALDVEGASRSDGARAQVWHANGTLAQRFEVRPCSDGTYTIRPAHSAAALEARGGDLVPTTPAVQRPFDAASRAQRWCFVAQPDGTVAILNAANGLALDVAGAQATAGTSVQLYPANGTAAQRWTLSEASAPSVALGVCALVPACAPSRVLDVTGASAAAGANVQLYRSNQTLAQRFEAKRVGDATAGPGGAYAFQSLLSGYLLTDRDGNVVMEPAATGDAAAAQQWAAKMGFGGTVLANLGTGRVLDVAGAQDVDGANIGTYAENGTLAQGFSVQPAHALAEGRTYAVRSALGDWQLGVGGAVGEAGSPITLGPVGDEGFQKFVASHRQDRVVLTNPVSGQCIDVKDGSALPGAPIQQWPPNGSPAQEFSLVPTGDGWFTICSATGMALEVAAPGGDGARLQLAAPGGSEGQRFRFVEVAPYVRLSGDAELDAIIDDLLDHRIGREGDALSRAFRYVAGYRYIDGSKWPTGEWSVPFAKEMYYNQGGNCYRFAALFCWLARGLGYDASVVVGEVPSRSLGWAPHGWVEIALDGTVYVCDPNMANAIPSRNWFMVTYGSAPVTYRK